MAVAATLARLAEEEMMNSEAGTDTSALARSARDDQAALERSAVLGGGNATLTADIVIKWTSRDFRCP